MIVTDLAHIDRQVLLTGGFRKATDFLRRQDLAAIPDGTIEIDGRKVFAIIQGYETETPPIARFEYHRDYIDIQAMVSGEEIIGWSPVERMTVTDPYDPEKDIAFGTVPQGAWTPLHLGAGQLAVLFPEDAHAPRLRAAAAPSRVRKIVIKVAVDAVSD